MNNKTFGDLQPGDTVWGIDHVNYRIFPKTVKSVTKQGILELEEYSALYVTLSQSRLVMPSKEMSFWSNQEDLVRVFLASKNATEMDKLWILQQLRNLETCSPEI